LNTVEFLAEHLDEIGAILSETGSPEKACLELEERYPEYADLFNDTFQKALPFVFCVLESLPALKSTGESDLNAKVANLEQELDATKIALGEKEQELESVKARLGRKKKRVLELKGELAAARMVLDDVQSRNRELEEELEAARGAGNGDEW
jgi:septal ring factor EnvC (AmiA/AmiB activator)